MAVVVKQSYYDLYLKELANPFRFKKSKELVLWYLKEIKSIKNIEIAMEYFGYPLSLIYQILSEKNKETYSIPEKYYLFKGQIEPIEIDLDNAYSMYFNEIMNPFYNEEAEQYAMWFIDQLKADINTKVEQKIVIDSITDRIVDIIYRIIEHRENNQSIDLFGGRMTTFTPGISHEEATKEKRCFYDTRNYITKGDTYIFYDPIITVKPYNSRGIKAQVNLENGNNVPAKQEIYLLKKPIICRAYYGYRLPTNIQQFEEETRRLNERRVVDGIDYDEVNYYTPTGLKLRKTSGLAHGKKIIDEINN